MIPNRLSSAVRRLCVRCRIISCSFLSTEPGVISIPRAPKFALGEENHFSYRVLQKHSKYKIYPFVVNPAPPDDNEKVNLAEIKWDYLSDDELCRVFHLVSSSAAQEGTPISEEKYTGMCVALSKKFSNMSDAHLKKMLKSLSLWPICSSVRDPNFYTVWRTLDAALDSRYREYSSEKAFELANLWFNVHLARKSDFVFHVVTRLANRTYKLKGDQVVLLLFYLNVLRTVAKGVNMFSVEERLAQVVNELSIEEIGVACTGFFKTQTTIHHPALLETIINKLIKNVAVVPDITLVCIVKALRYKLPIKLWHRLPELIDSLQSQVQRLSITSSVHIPLLLTTSLLVHDGILNEVSQKLINNIEKARLKDMEKLAFALTQLNCHTKLAREALETIASALDNPEREQEFQEHPKCLAVLLHYLAMNKLFANRLIDRVLNVHFLNEVYGKNKYVLGREILCLDTTVELENPSYEGNRLLEPTRNYLSRRYSDYIPDPERNMSFHGKLMYEVIKTAENLTRKQCISKYLLPNHPRADIVVRLGANGEFLPLSKELENVENFTGPIRAPGSDYLAIIPLSRNMFLRNAESGFMGECDVKVRQLKVLGFHPVLVRGDSWPRESSPEEKEAHLRQLVLSSLSSGSS